MLSDLGNLALELSGASTTTAGPSISPGHRPESSLWLLWRTRCSRKSKRVKTQSTTPTGSQHPFRSQSQARKVRNKSREVTGILPHKFTVPLNVSISQCSTLEVLCVERCPSQRSWGIWTKRWSLCYGHQASVMLLGDPGPNETGVLTESSTDPCQKLFKGEDREKVLLWHAQGHRRKPGRQTLTTWTSGLQPSRQDLRIFPSMTPGLWPSLRQL